MHVLPACLPVYVHVLTEWFSVLVHPTDYAVHVHNVMHADWLSNIIVLCACVSKFCYFLVYRYKYFQSQVTETDRHTSI